MKLTEIAIKVTDRNRKAVIEFLTEIRQKPDKLSYIYKENCYVFFYVGIWTLSRTLMDRNVVSLTKAKQIHEKENKPQPTHEQLKSERGRSAMYRLKYEEAKKSCHRLNDLLNEVNESLGLEEGLNSRLKSLIKENNLNYRERVKNLLRDKKSIIEDKMILETKVNELEKDKKEMVISNGKVISELDSYKEKLVEYSRTIEGLKISKKELNIEFIDLEDKNDILVTQNGKLINKVASTISDVNKLNGDIKILTNQLKESKQSELKLRICSIALCVAVLIMMLIAKG